MRMKRHLVGRNVELTCNYRQFSAISLKKTGESRR